MRKECIRFGLAGRFTMKEALVELAITLVRNNLDPRSYQFYPSQPLQGQFPYQVEILTDLVETMKALPTTSGALSYPRVSCASSPRTSSSPITGVTSSMSSQAPICSNVVFSPNYPPPTTSKPTGIDASLGLDNQVLKKILNSVEKIQEVLEKTMLSPGYGDSDSESFTTAAMSSSSRCASLSNRFKYSSTDYGSQSSSFSSTSSSDMSSSLRPGKPWTKAQLREENICLKFQHDSCQFSGDHAGNSHLCARCYFSKHMLLENDHSSDCCQMDLS